MHHTLRSRPFKKYTWLVLITFCAICTKSWAQTTDFMETSSKQQLILKMVSQIKTETDPSFIYEFEQTKFVPPPGKTLLIMGQTLESTDEYMASFADQPKPGGWSAYWGIPEFRGVTESVSYMPNNTQNHQKLVDDFPNSVIQSAMWMVGHDQVAENASIGLYDDVAKKYAEWAKSIDRPIYLRIGYEFDGIHNAIEPHHYKRAYWRIVDLIRAEGVTNIAFVWHSYASTPFKNYQISEWYPGDDYVDWVAISVFGQAYSGSDFGIHTDEVLEFAMTHKKPVMIAESNPINGIYANNKDSWENWFVNYFSFIYEKNIKAFSFINEDWPRIGLDGISDWKDSRLYNNSDISKAWFMEVNKNRYLKQSESLFEMLGYLVE